MQLGAGPNYLANAFGSGLMAPNSVLQAGLPRPPTVSVHDNSHMGRKAFRVQAQKEFSFGIGEWIAHPFDQGGAGRGEGKRLRVSRHGE
jgi:hypothetical protein